jgi:hypothetical protein
MSYSVISTGRNKLNSSQAIFDDLAEKETRRDHLNQQLKQAKKQQDKSVTATAVGTMASSAINAAATGGAAASAGAGATAAGAGAAGAAGGGSALATVGAAMGPIGWTALAGLAAYKLFA